jgi:hypothetical protein
MSTNPSPSVRLADILLGQDLGSWVGERRDAGLSWEKVAAELLTSTNGQVKITGEWLRRLYSPTADAPANGDAA